MKRLLVLCALPLLLAGCNPWDWLAPKSQKATVKGCEYILPQHIDDTQKIYNGMPLAAAIKLFATNKSLTEEQAKTCFE